MKKVLLIGDSISLYYSPYLQDYLKDQIVLYRKEDPKDAFANLDHPTGPNGGDSARVLNYLKDRFKAEAPDFDLFAFNCGLHDIKHIHGGDCVISPRARHAKGEDLEGYRAEFIRLVETAQLLAPPAPQTPPAPGGNRPVEGDL